MLSIPSRDEVEDFIARETIVESRKVSAWFRYYLFSLVLEDGLVRQDIPDSPYYVRISTSAIADMLSTNSKAIPYIQNMFTFENRERWQAIIGEAFVKAGWWVVNVDHQYIRVYKERPSPICNDKPCYISVQTSSELYNDETSPLQEAQTSLYNRVLNNSTRFNIPPQESQSPIRLDDPIQPDLSLEDLSLRSDNPLTVARIRELQLNMQRIRGNSDMSPAEALELLQNNPSPIAPTYPTPDDVPF